MFQIQSNELQRIVDDLRLAASSSSAADREFVAGSLAMYGEACQAANERLRRVGQLLDRGLRSEAIQAAEQSPALLELVGLLDFPELAALRVWLEQAGMAAPPALFLEVGQQLNSAYAEDKQLSVLLRRHRLLALAKAPLAARIAVLRDMRAEDPANPTWPLDLEILERARQRQLKAELKQAFDQGNLDELTMLTRETLSPLWSQPAPADVTALAMDLQSRLARQRATEELKVLAAELDSSYSEFDATKARAIRAKWLVVHDRAQLPPGHPLAERAAPALEWLNELDRQDERASQFTRSIAELERALDANKPALDLERLYHLALRYGESIQPQLAQRLGSRLEEHRLRLRRRTRLILTSVICLIFLVAAGSYAAVARQIHLRGVADAVAAVSHQLDAESLEEAQRFLDDLTEKSPAVANSSAVRDQRARLEKLQRVDADRAGAFRTVMDRAKQAGAESPDQSALAEARRLAKREKDRVEIAELEARIGEVFRRKQLVADEGFTAKLKEIQQEVAANDRRELSDSDTAEQEMQRILTDIRAARSLPGVSTALKNQLDPLQARVEAKRDEARRLREQAADLAGLTRQAGDAAAFAQALRAYATRFPESQRSREFLQVAEEAPLWTSFVAWSSFFAAGKPETFDNPSAARQRLDAGNQLLASHKDCPLSESFRRQLPYLEAAVARVQDGRAATAPLKKLFEDSLVADLVSIYCRDGKRYYLKELPPKFDDLAANERFNFEYITGFDLATKRGRVGRDEVIMAGEAPQAALSKKALELLDGVDSAGWDRTMLELVNLFADDAPCDAVLRVIILKRILEVGCAGSVRFRQAFGARQSLLVESSLDLTVNWVDPTDVAAAQVRKNVVSLIESFQKTGLGKVDAPPLSIPLPAWNGLVWRDAKGNWQWRKSSTIADGATLLVLVRAGVAEQRLTPVGQWREQRIAWNSAAESQLREGRPIFVLAVAPTSSADSSANRQP